MTATIHQEWQSFPQETMEAESPWRRAWDHVEERRRRRPAASSRPWKGILFGQAIALIACSMNASAYTLTNHFHIELQLFQLFVIYLFLSLHMLRRNDTSRLQIDWRIYASISVLDVLPNFMTLLSFHYTSLTSTTLLGSLCVPSTLFFSKYVLGRRYRLPQYVGVVLCMVGGSLTVWSDAVHHSYVGDLLALTAALMYGLGDTVAEYAIKHIDRNEYLGMLGVCGSVLTGFSFPLLERDGLKHLTTLPPTERWHVSMLMLWYVASVLGYYIAEGAFLVSSDAALLNLSMQATNVWAILFTVLAFDKAPSAAFYVAFALVVSGVIVYETGSEKPGSTPSTPIGVHRVESEPLAHELTRSDSYGSDEPIDV